MESLAVTVGREGPFGVFLANRFTRRKVSLASWRAADAVGHLLAYQARGVYPADLTRVGAFASRREDDDLVVEVRDVDGRWEVFAVMPLPFALEIGNLLLGKAREIQTEEDYEDVVFDHAILQRTGVLPQLGLVNDPYLHREAAKEAAWNSQLRRYLPGGVKRQRQVNTPNVEKEPLSG